MEALLYRAFGGIARQNKKAAKAAFRACILGGIYSFVNFTHLLDELTLLTAYGPSLSAGLASLAGPGFGLADGSSPARAARTFFSRMLASIGLMT